MNISARGNAGGVAASLPSRCQACCACWRVRVAPEPAPLDPVLPVATPSWPRLGRQVHPDITLVKPAPRDDDVVVVLKDESTYCGQLVDGKRHGRGRHSFCDGLVYEGQWIDDVQCGEGTERFPDGTVFKGSYVHGMRNGFGIMVWPEGSEYSGQFRNGKANGKGHLLRTDGSVYSGEFTENCMCGEGCMKWCDGAEYTGQFLANKRDGMGRMEWSSGKWKCYDGRWRDGMLHGPGTMCDLTDRVFTGTFYFGKLVQWDHEAKGDAEELMQVPRCWRNQDAGMDFCERAEVSEGLQAQIQELLQGTFRDVGTRDRAGEVPKRLKLLKCHRVESRGMWSRYIKAKSRVLARRANGVVPVNKLDGDPDSGFVRTQMLLHKEFAEQLDASVNEHYLWHGTTPEGAVGISTNGFRISLAGLRAGTYFGRGCYFAECSSKSDEYAREGEDLLSGVFALLLCRVTCGSLFRITRPDGEAIEAALATGEYDAVLGDRLASVGTYREFVIYDEELAYPEFVVLYERKID